MRKLFMLFAGGFMAFAVYADGTQINDGSGFNVVIRKVKKDPEPHPVRPRVPGLDRFLTVSFSEGVMTVEMPGDAESGVVTLGTGAFEVFTAAIDRSCNTVELPPLSGEFLLTVTFDNGDVYEGEIVF